MKLDENLNRLHLVVKTNLDKNILRGRKMNKKLFCLLVIFAGLSLTTLYAQEKAPAAETEAVAETTTGSSLKYIAAAIAVGVACIGGGMAVGKIGAAAMGAMSENAELSGKALPFVGLAEGICLWGMLVGVLILIL